VSKPARLLRHRVEDPLKEALTVRYMILIHSNPNTWDALSWEQRKQLGREHMALDAALQESGERVAGEGLADTELTKCVTFRDGERVVSDGPFAEAKEHLAGFYLVDVDSEERALEIAAQIPDARFTQVEVRPVLDFKTADL
jgi:hypothetical protein